METTLTAGNPQFAEMKQRMKAVWREGDFGQIAPFSQQEAESFVRRLELRPGMKVLDVGCGTGNQAIPAARTGAMVTAVDIAPNLLAQARQRAEAEKLHVDFREADVEALPFADGKFDVVFSMFAAMFAPRPKIAAAEMVRVCRKGGLIAMVNWTPEGFVGEQNKIMTRYAPPPPPGLESFLLWGDEAVVQERFGAGVVVSTSKRVLTFDIPMRPSATEAHFRQYSGWRQLLTQQLNPARRDALIRELTEQWAKHNRGNERHTVVDAEYLEVYARPS